MDATGHVDKVLQMYRCLLGQGEVLHVKWLDGGDDPRYLKMWTSLYRLVVWLVMLFPVMHFWLRYCYLKPTYGYLRILSFVHGQRHRDDHGSETCILPKNIGG
jgi:hypothetical protein